MTGAVRTEDANAAVLMAQYGITRVPAEQFHLAGWRYTNLADTLAQARKIAAANSTRNLSEGKRFGHEPTSWQQGNPDA